MSVERHEIHQESVGAYLLGALDDAELQAFESHLAECHVCMAEVERLRPAAEALPRSVQPIAPPPRLKAALMAEVEGTPEPRPSAWARLRERVGARRDARLGVRPAVAWASAAFVLAVGILAGYGATTLTGDGGARTLAASVNQTELPVGSGSLTIPGEQADGAILRVHGMPSLDSTKTYQVWVRRKGETISQGLFSVGQDGNGSAAVLGDLEGADAVMVTREPAGGARAPSEKPVLTVSL